MKFCLYVTIPITIYYNVISVKHYYKRSSCFLFYFTDHADASTWYWALKQKWLTLAFVFICTTTFTLRLFKCPKKRANWWFKRQKPGWVDDNFNLGTVVRLNIHNRSSLAQRSKPHGFLWRTNADKTWQSLSLRRMSDGEKRDTTESPL